MQRLHSRDCERPERLHPAPKNPRRAPRTGRGQRPRGSWFDSGRQASGRRRHKPNGPGIPHRSGRAHVAKINVHSFDGCTAGRKQEKDNAQSGLSQRPLLQNTDRVRLLRRLFDRVDHSCGQRGKRQAGPNDSVAGSRGSTSPDAERQIAQASGNGKHIHGTGSRRSQLRKSWNLPRELRFTPARLRRWTLNLHASNVRQALRGDHSAQPQAVPPRHRVSARVYPATGCPANEPKASGPTLEVQGSAHDAGTHPGVPDHIPRCQGTYSPYFILADSTQASLASPASASHFSLATS
jgi:hypothetical protein